MSLGRLVLPLVLLAAMGDWADAQKQVFVRTVSGRSFLGTIDSRTNDDVLHLRIGVRSAEMVRTIAWDRVTGAVIDDEELTRDELKARAPALSAEEFHRVPPPRRPKPPREPKGDPAPSVRSIAIDARIANWDADVHTDGILLNFIALDEQGRSVPVDGTLDVQLWTIDHRLAQHASQTGGRTVVMLGRWSQSLSGTATNSGYTLRLPYSTHQPEYEATLMPYGVLHVRASIPGHGVFEQAIDGVRLRPFSPVSNYLQTSGFDMPLIHRP